ncbi:Rio2, N-terminal-domain-containing protein [Chaetomium tenue]|uniref:Rio2, N-terminal-domain-containing protein n=1 Tax=Chaetomium tenue TaxID=1854479 RepID=A0ACB7P6I6_9PEZI|nr:Rio2, N-terminal-domain-containing protein [Chaetomium globosum]
MKLDTRAMRYLTAEDWRVLTAVEICSKNHELVPTTLIERTARLKGGASGVHKSISALAKVGLISRMKEAKYDGYRLSYGGLDYLALHTHASRKQVYSVGTRVGVGKESDIMIVADDKGTQKILKIHRLGRISFRTVKTNRDYLKKHQSGSWMYLSRLAAIKEYAFMQALREEGFPVPEPIAQSRHTIVMSLIDAPPMRQIASVPDPAALYAELISLILRLAKHGLIHGDFNEFNILIREDKIENESTNTNTDTATDTPTDTPEKNQDAPSITLTPILIDFPQMVSMDHQNAEMYFDRDVECVKRFFSRRFHFVSTEPGPFFKDAKKTVGRDGVRRLDAVVEASGFTKKMAKDLEAAIREQQANPKNDTGDSDEEEDESEDEDEDEDEDGDEGLQVIGDQIVSTEEGLEKLAINDGT